MVFARSDFRDGARQKPAAQAADPISRRSSNQLLLIPPPSRGRDKDCAGVDLAAARVFLNPDECSQFQTVAGASARAAESFDLWADRRRAGGGGAAVLAKHFRRRAVAALGGVGDF